MGEKTAITWTDHTFNVWIGCHKISPACRDCYAARYDARWGGGHWGLNAPRRFFADKHWNDPIRWNRAAMKAGERRHVFCSSLADVFERHPVDETNAQMDDARLRLWRIIELTPRLDWLLLTKRPENIADMLPRSWLDGPLKNVWHGTTAENQDEFDKRWAHLAKVPAAVRFLSVEPMLGPVDLARALPPCDCDGMFSRSHNPSRGCPVHDVTAKPRPDWAIVGGESGGNARRMDPAWALDVKRQCQGAGVAFFMKQTGVVLGREWGCKHPHGAAPAEWPIEFRVQQFPKAHL